MRNAGTSKLCALAAAFLFMVSAAQSQTRLAVPSYQNPGTSTWNGWAAQGPGGVGLMIVNLKNGDDTSYKSSIDTAIQRPASRACW